MAGHPQHALQHGWAGAHSSAKQPIADGLLSQTLGYIIQASLIQEQGRPCTSGSRDGMLRQYQILVGTTVQEGCMVLLKTGKEDSAAA